MADQRDPDAHSDGDVAKAEANLLATVLELTLVVAQTGARVVPPFEPPAALRPFLQFKSKIPPPALRAARRVLDEDPLFRARVATVATDELVGRAGSLYVRRPDGWEADFTSAVIDTMGEASQEGAAKRAGRLSRKLAGVEAALLRAESELIRTKTELITTQNQLADERRNRAVIAGELADVRQRVERLAESEEHARAAGERSSALARRLTVERDEALARAGASEDELGRRESFDSAVARALSSLDDLGAALRSVSGSPSPSAPSATPAVGRSIADPRTATDPAAGQRRAKTGSGGVGKARRTAIALPPGVFDDTVDAATALFRTSNVMVLVDAYNVAKWRWPTAGPADLRDRLLAMASQISHRTGAAIHLVFDGAHAGGTMKPGGTARVRVIYTAEAVEADDVVLDMAAKAPLHVPIVVVSNDMRVVDGAIALGVNVVPCHAFAALSTSG